ncbi:MAG: hydantoinase B/oxoprolinase family protein [Nitrospinota bacterium]
MAELRTGRLDPITFEILRHRLWAINSEASTTVELVSGSSVATEAHDMNTSLMNAEGDVCVVGVLSLAKATTMSDVVKDILQNYQDNPGIGPEDGFLCNDPYLGVQHQNDVAYVAPIAVGDELVAWAGAEIHQVDVGGPVAGQVQLGAKDIFGEAPIFPPVKVLENGQVRRDIEREYLRRSRLPDLVGLDLRAKIAACNVSRQRLRELAEEVGLETVRACVGDMIDYAERRFRDRLLKIPDGTWRHRTFVDFDGEIYPLQIAMAKEGDRLVFDFSGCAPQAPAVINCTRKALVAIIRGYLCTLTCWDIPWCPSGIGKAVEIRSEPGTIVDAEYPAGVSKATTSVVWSVGKAVGFLVGKMLVSSRKFRDRAMSSWQGATVVEDLFGQDQHGRRFGATLLDGLAGGAGARTWADGIDTGGYLGSIATCIANVERYESEYPLLYLARRQFRDSGGPGAFRGGVGISCMYICHGVERIPDKMMHCIGGEVPLSPGTSGGYSSSTNRFLIKRKTNVRQRLARSEIPLDFDAMEGELEVHASISRTHMDVDDVYLSRTMGGGGFGDPIERNPDWVLRDVLDGWVSPAQAHRVYGVVLTGDQKAMDDDATALRREEIRAGRLAAAQGGREPPPGEPAEVIAAVNDALTLHRVAGLGDETSATLIVCKCVRVICQGAENYKLHVPWAGYPLSQVLAEMDPHYPETGRFECREYYCPNCARLIETDIALKEDPILWDVELAPGNVQQSEDG